MHLRGIVELAQEGIGEVRRFKRSKRAAAKSISVPLAVYLDLLRAVRKNPECRLMEV